MKVRRVSNSEDPGQKRLNRLKNLVDVETDTSQANKSDAGPASVSTAGGTVFSDPIRPGARPTSVREETPEVKTTSHGSGLLVLGLVIAVGILAAVIWQVGGSVNILWNPAGLLIVLGGTFAATLLSFRPAQVWMLLRVGDILFHRDMDAQAEVDDLMFVVRTHFKSGAREAEKKLDGMSNHFLKLGLQMAIDGTPVEDMVHALNWRLQKLQERDFADARLFRTMALFAPAFGMFGTVAGLIGMLQDLGSRDLELIGANMAVALVTTFYGLFLGYLVFRPLAIRVEQNSERRIARLNVLVQGVLLFRLGRRPATIEDSVKTLLDSYQHAQRGPRD